jgi:hypothetical protein
VPRAPLACATARARLAPELVARKGHDLQPLRAILVVQRDQLLWTHAPTHGNVLLASQAGRAEHIAAARTA